MKPLDNSFNETNTLYTFLIRPLCFPVIKIRSSVINWTYSQTHVFSLLVKIQSISLSSYFNYGLTWKWQCLREWELKWENMLKQRDHVFLKSEALKWWKLTKIKIDYWDTKKLLSFKNPASSQPKLKAATSLSRKRLIQPKHLISENIHPLLLYFLWINSHSLK